MSNARQWHKEFMRRARYAGARVDWLDDRKNRVEREIKEQREETELQHTFESFEAMIAEEIAEINANIDETMPDLNELPPLFELPEPPAEELWDPTAEENNNAQHAANGNIKHKPQKKQEKDRRQRRTIQQDEKFSSQYGWLLTIDHNKEAHSLNGNRSFSTAGLLNIFLGSVTVSVVALTSFFVATIVMTLIPIILYGIYALVAGSLLRLALFILPYCETLGDCFDSCFWWLATSAFAGFGKIMRKLFDRLYIKIFHVLPSLRNLFIDVANKFSEFEWPTEFAKTTLTTLGADIRSYIIADLRMMNRLTRTEIIVVSEITIASWLVRRMTFVSETRLEGSLPASEDMRQVRQMTASAVNLLAVDGVMPDLVGINVYQKIVDDKGAPIILRYVIDCPAQGWRVQKTGEITSLLVGGVAFKCACGKQFRTAAIKRMHVEQCQEQEVVDLTKLEIHRPVVASGSGKGKAKEVYVNADEEEEVPLQREKKRTVKQKSGYAQLEERDPNNPDLRVQPGVREADAEKRREEREAEEELKENQPYIRNTESYAEAYFVNNAPATPSQVKFYIAQRQVSTPVGSLLIFTRNIIRLHTAAHPDWVWDYLILFTISIYSALIAHRFDTRDTHVRYQNAAEPTIQHNNEQEKRPLDERPQPHQQGKIKIKSIVETLRFITTRRVPIWKEIMFTAAIPYQRRILLTIMAVEEETINYYPVELSALQAVMSPKVTPMASFYSPADLSSRVQRYLGSMSHINGTATDLAWLNVEHVAMMRATTYVNTNAVPLGFRLGAPIVD